MLSSMTQSLRRPASLDAFWAIPEAERFHEWIVDPRDATLTIMRWTPDGYVTRARAERGDGIYAEPFEAIEIDVGTLFGDDSMGT